MDLVKLEKANTLNKSIKENEQLLSNCNNHKCEFIYFSFGNGSAREIVCNDEKIINKVRGLIRKETNEILTQLKKEFKEL